MTNKKKHPLTKEQRLLLKKVKSEKKTKTNHVGKVRRGLIEPLQEQETQDELERVDQYRDQLREYQSLDRTIPISDGSGETQ